MATYPQPTTYTDDELAGLPQTSQVFEAPNLIFDAHQWRQEGYELHDACSPSTATCVSVGIPIPSGKLLVKKGGGYDLIDETIRQSR